MTDRPPRQVHPIDRRAFLGALATAFLAACTDRGSDQTAPVDAGRPSTSASTSTSQPVTTTPPTSVVTDADRVEPLETPPVDVPDDAFGLGIASGEPDHESVALWTRLIGESLPDRFDIVWEVARDEQFETLVATALAAVDEVDAHACHVVADELDPDTTYWYRFRAGSVTSAVGRTATMPTGLGRPITLGVSSCQARTDGAWAAHGDIAVADLDVMVWLGDFIYGDHTTVDGYRSEYVAALTDPLLQASRAAHPWVVFADDHEVANDYDAAVDPDRRAAAYRAWWEHQPTRLARPGTDGRIDLGRSMDLGGVRLIGLDPRQFADDATLLGVEQWARVETEIAEAAAGNIDGSIGHVVIASPVIMSGLRDLEGLPLVPCSIDAYPEERTRLASLLATLESPTIVSGDLHTSLVADFSADPLDAGAAPVALEIMAPAISSAFPERFAPLAPFLPLVNPQLRNVEVRNGWLRLEVSDQGPVAAFHFVDDVTDPDSSITVRPISL